MCDNCGENPVMTPSPYGDGSDEYEVCGDCYDPTPLD